ncbi:MAG: DUF3604 domain-containing protein [Acidobacteria bacterium]|nr:DUF3604 domain-containing protein [Acidobacteriota bacterium]
MKTIRVVPVVLAVSAVATLVALQQQGSRGAGAGAGDDTVAVLVRLGVRDQAPADWTGTVTATGGDVVALSNWRPRPGDEVNGVTGWTLRTRKGPNFVTRPWEAERLVEPRNYIQTPGVVISVRGSAATRLKVVTPRGAFETTLAGGRFLNGQVEVDAAPSPQTAAASGEQNDYPSTVAMDDGSRWVAWLSYAGDRNRVMARRHDGAAWGPEIAVTEAAGDYFLVKAAGDGKGGVWFFWSSQEGGNWDLHARRHAGGSWSAAERLTTDAQPDIFPSAARDSAGNVWVAWQGFRNGKADIFARRHDGSTWGEAMQVSSSPANDWEPSIAADGAGRVYVAWDTYDKGNYDAAYRAWDGTRWGEVGTVAGTPKFEAHVTLTVDPSNRVWFAWNESGYNWGKDTGFLVRKQATLLYSWRAMNVAVLDGGRWLSPRADLDAVLPDYLQGFNDYPHILADANGKVWLFFRHRTIRIADTPGDTPLHRAAWEWWGATYTGGAWSRPFALPESAGRQDMRAGFTADKRGNVYAAWATDQRDFEEFLFRKTQVHAGRLTGVSGTLAPPELAERRMPKLNVFPMHAGEVDDLARIRGYAIQNGGKTYHIYRGDTHRHTEFSMDGNNDGSLLHNYRYAMDAAELDYLMISEHNGAGGPDEKYISFLLQQMADILALGGKFTPLYGYERSVGYPNGHRNVIFATRGNPTLPIPATEQKAADGAQALYAYLKKYKGIAISHTSASSMGTDWRDNDPEVEPLVEIYQGDRVSAEYEGAPKAAFAKDLASAPGGLRPLGYVWNAWAKGYKLGVQASSDHLSTHISYACTIATDYTRQGLIDAMKQRHSYGATDNIVLDYRMESGGKEYLQGDIIENGRDVRIKVKVLGTAPIRQIDVIRNNQFIHNLNPMQKDTSFEFADPKPKAGESYYYVRVIQVDDQMAWSSPVWIRRGK